MGALALGLTFGGVAVADPVVAQPVAAVAAPGDVAPQFGNSIVCNVLDRLADRFEDFPFVQSIINGLRARFGCISPG